MGAEEATAAKTEPGYFMRNQADKAPIDIVDLLHR